MDRPIMYVDQIPLVEQFLAGYRETQTALGWIAQGMLGPGPYVDALPVTPTSPVSMAINVGPGQVFSIQNVDSTAYGNLDADVSHSVLKQFVTLDTVTETLVAPTTTGYAINYLIQVAASEVDDTPVLLPYYNSANPAQPFSGPPTNANPPTSSGDEQMTRRACKVVINAKGGIPALSGQQTTPAADAGFIGIYVVTVAQGATAIHSGDISIISSAPWVTPKLCEIPRDVQSGEWEYAGTASPSGSTFSAVLNPIPIGLTIGMAIRAKMSAQAIANGQLNVNGFGAIPIVRRGGQALVGTEWLANDVVDFRFTGSSWQLVGLTLADIPAIPVVSPFLAHSVVYVRTDGDDANDGLSNSAGGALKTIAAAFTKISQNLTPAGSAITIQLGIAGTYAGPQVWPNLGNVTLAGDTGNASNYIVTSGSGGSLGGVFNVAGSWLTSGVTLQNTSTNYGTVFVGGASSFQASHTGFVNTVTNSVGHCTAFAGGSFTIQDNCWTSGNTGYFGLAEGPSSFGFGPFGFTLNGTPAYAQAFVIAQDLGYVGASGTTFAGSATGTRYISRNNSLIQTFGSGATFFPGSTSGSLGTGGLYV